MSEIDYYNYWTEKSAFQINFHSVIGFILVRLLYHQILKSFKTITKQKASRTKEL